MPLSCCIVSKQNKMTAIQQLISIKSQNKNKITNMFSVKTNNNSCAQTNKQTTEEHKNTQNTNGHSNISMKLWTMNRLQIARCLSFNSQLSQWTTITLILRMQYAGWWWWFINGTIFIERAIFCTFLMIQSTSEFQ